MRRRAGKKADDGRRVGAIAELRTLRSEAALTDDAAVGWWGQPGTSGVEGNETGASVTDWWSVGSGIAGATATFAATGVALWVALRDGRPRDAERRDQEAAQARLVTFTGLSDGRLLITNHSLLPILRLLVTAKVQEADGGWKFLALRNRTTVPWPVGS